MQVRYDRIPRSDEPMIKYRAIFRKYGGLVLISHLDLMTVIRRTIRRSGLPYVLTGGFTPRVRISMPRALKLGVESDNEEMFLWLREEIGCEDILSSLNALFPEGLIITKISGVDTANRP